MIKLKNINKQFNWKQNALTALNDINLSILPGQIVGIIGESGAGKSTLLRTVNLLERPTSGNVHIGDLNITELSGEELRVERRKIGMIFQQYNLLSARTAFENIALPLELVGTPKNQIEKEVNELLELVKLKPYAHHYPDQLSGGQKQRIAIARALATKPSILLCDEPTSALDSKSTKSILNLLKEINQRLNITILIITHELNVIKHICDYAGVMHQGELIEYDTVVNLFAQPKTKTARELIEKSLHMELPQTIASQLQTEASPNKSRIVKLIFLGGSNSSQPLIATLIKEFNITISILQANIEHLQETTIGFTVCQISGDDDSIEKAIKSIPSQEVKVEVLGYV